MYKGKKQTKTDGRGGLFLMSLGISLGILLAASLIMSAVAYSSADPTGKIGIYSLVSLIVSAALAGFIASRLSDSVGLSTLTALATVLILILVGAVISGGKLGLGALMNYLCYFGVATLFSLFAKKRVRRHKRR